MGPLSTDQITVPTQQCVGLDEEPAELPPVQQTAETSKECPIRRPQGRAVHLVPQDRDLVAEHGDLDNHIGVVAAPERRSCSVRMKAR